MERHRKLRPISVVVLLSAILFTALPASSDMMQDSPVTFPEKGALPARYRPDQPSRGNEAEEEGYYIFGTPERSLAQIRQIQSEMPEGKFAPPPQDWTFLTRTRDTLMKGGDLHILGLGDSIVNDTMRSGWIAKLQETYPRAKITGTVYVRGGGGCQHYKEGDRIAENVVPRQPHLVFIGGISQKSIDDIRIVIRQLRKALPEVEIILATGVFGRSDPRSPVELAKAAYSGTGRYGQLLKILSADEGCAFLDMTSPWAEYIRSSGLHPHLFYRDVVHANEFGEQILSKILISFLTDRAHGKNRSGQESGQPGDTFEGKGRAKIALKVDLALPTSEKDSTPVPGTLKHGWTPFVATRWADMYMHDGTWEDGSGGNRPPSTAGLDGTGVHVMLDCGSPGNGGFAVYGMSRDNLGGGGRPTGTPQGDPIANGWFHNIDWGGERTGDIFVRINGLPAGEYEMLCYHNHWEPRKQSTRNSLDQISQMPNLPLVHAMPLPAQPLEGCRGWDIGLGTGKGVRSIRQDRDIDVTSATEDANVGRSVVRFMTDGSNDVLVVIDGGDNEYPDPARRGREGSKAVLNAFEINQKR